MTVRIESLAHAQTEFLKRGSHVEILAPPELREHMARTAANLAAMYSALKPAHVALGMRTGAGSMGPRSRAGCSWQLLQPGGGEQVPRGGGRRVCPHQVH